MKKGYLSEYFEGVGVKVLSEVDATAKSNQHEIGTTKAMRHFLGEDKTKFEVNYIWLGGEQESISDQDWATHYNTREGKPRSAEYRFYYPSNNVTELMSAGDTLFLAMRKDRSILFIVVPENSGLTSHLLWLFGIDEQPELQFTAQQFGQDNDAALDFAARLVLDEIGVEFEDPNANTLDTIIDRFGSTFPTTAEFSQLARLTLPEVHAEDDPDAALIAWLDHEEAMFRRLEKKIVAERILKGFVGKGEVDVDAFIHYSLGVQNRRKSRMGHSLEHHLKAVFDACSVRYDAQVITEKGKKPDFIFPGQAEYEDPNFSVSLLTMLAAKSSCKDRWSQVLPEAERIPLKHLVTLELGISESQTETMAASNVQLIVPTRLQSSYTAKQRAWLWPVSTFVDEVQRRQEQIEAP
ncbi:type II restriction endonuclease [Erythrobacter sp.]|uniref:type II restriction endonuclease n=1 Tax=Erythrobacter sp. TaxID=1042 RepID=UPI001B0B3B9B|nr:type II restriction endonuclease [Erythrobacter sp.]MBO6527844.1 restriction endonuclease [Erythrobacter sp.]MBO6531461.1 restriction endonuclease [Erythrobacter sp.]